MSRSYLIQYHKRNKIYPFVFNNSLSNVKILTNKRDNIMLLLLFYIIQIINKRDNNLCLIGINAE